KWTYNANAKKLYEVRVTVDYLVEGYPQTTPMGFENNLSQDDYHYILELNGEGKVIGGRYCTDTTNTHIDFLWSPTGGHSPSNPYVASAKVEELVAKSVAPETTSPSGEAKEFVVTPNAAIPD